MWDFELMAAVRAIEKSMAYALYRLMLCFGAALGYLLATLAGAGTLVGFGSLAKNALALGPLGALVGFALFAWLMFKIRPTWLNIVHIPQLALLADQTRGISLPSGKAQVDHAKRRQTESFPSTRKLFELDEAMRQTQADMADLHPCPKLPSDRPAISNLAMNLVRRLSALNDQTLLAWHLYTGSDNPWRSVAKGLAVQEQHFAAMTRNRLAATVFAWLGLVAAYPLFLAGIEMLIDDIPINFSFWPKVFAGVFAWAVKAAFFDAIAEAAMMQVFFPWAEQEPDASAVETLARHSASYREILRKAGEQPDEP